jgi:hypothetical protein
MVEGYAVTSCNLASRETRNKAERISFEDRSREEKIYAFCVKGFFSSYDVALIGSVSAYGPYNVAAKQGQKRRVSMV